MGLSVYKSGISNPVNRLSIYDQRLLSPFNSPIRITKPLNWFVLLLIGLTIGIDSHILAQGSANSQLEVTKLVDKTKANQGDQLTYKLILANKGTTPASNIAVRDSSSTGLRYLSNSATPPTGTTFTAGSPISTWSVGNLSAGQSLTLTFQAIADSSGVLYNTATIPGDTAVTCTTIPIRTCVGDDYLFRLTAPAGRTSYRWFKDGVELTKVTTNTLDVTTPGSYSLTVDNGTGKCPDLSLCPFIVEADTLPNFQVSAIPVSCTAIPQANGQLIISGFNPTHTYQYSTGTSFNSAASLSGSPKTIPANGILVNNLANPASSAPYTIRVYNGATCYIDQTVTLQPSVCCGLSVVTTAGLCTTATNTYSSTAVITVTNPSAGTLTVADGPQSITFITTAAISGTFTAVFTGLISNGTSHTVTASLPGCSTTTSTYSAPISCSAGTTPTCSVGVPTITAGLCASATNTYSMTALVKVNNPTAGGTLNITNGTTTQPFVTTAGTANTFTMVFNGLPSDGLSHSITASLTGCSTTTTTYTAPASCSTSTSTTCSVGTPVITAGVCSTATNTYSTTATVTVQNPTSGGTLSITNGTTTQAFTTTAGTANTFTMAFSGLSSNGSTNTITATLAGCGSASATYSAPVSCSTATVCSMSAVVKAGACTPATNTYSATVVVGLTNIAPGVLTIGLSGSVPISQTLAANTTSFTAVFAELLSDGASHTVTASLPGCPTTTATYSAPLSCSIAPTPSLALTLNPGPCQTPTNQYTLTATLSLVNALTGTATLTDGTTTATASVSAGAVSLPFSVTGLLSGTGVHTVSVSYLGQTISTTYAAPLSCTVAPVCSLSALVTAGQCSTATNTYSTTATVALANPPAGVLTVSTGGQSLTTTLASGLSSFTFTAIFNSLISDGATHTLTASLPGCTSLTTPYSAPASCRAELGLSVIDPGVCQPGTNTYTSMGLINLTNAVAGTALITDGASSLSLAISAGTVALPYSLSGLPSGTGVHTVSVSYLGQTISTTYTAPGSCSVAAPVCSLTAVATAGVCQTATNTYSTTVVVNLDNSVTGVLIVSLPGSVPVSQTLTANTTSFTAVFAGLVSDGASHIAMASLSGCGIATAAFTAPVSCSVAPLCSVGAVATAGVCNPATNTYSATAIVTVLNPVAGNTVSVTTGGQTLSFSTTTSSQNTFTATFNGLVSDGLSHTVVVSVPNCNTVNALYTAPANCSVVAVCSLTATATAGPCATATNKYSSTAIVQLTNPIAGTLTLTDGPQSITFATTAASSATFTAVFTGLISSGSLHTVLVSLPGCPTTTATYSAPLSCSIAPTPSLALTLNPGPCQTPTNQYTLTATLSLVNALTGTATLTDGTTTATASVSAGAVSLPFSVTGLLSGTGVHTVSVSYLGQTISTTYAAPLSCTVAPVCSLSALVTAGQCSTATNTYSTTATVALANPPAGVLTVSTGGQSLTTTLASGLSSFTFTAIFNSLISDGATHTLTASLPGCTSLTTPYSAPASCRAELGLSVIDPGVCQPGTNTYTSMGLINLTNAVAGTALITDGASSLSLAISAGTVALPYSLSGLPSGTGVHTVSVSYLGQTISTTYTAPGSCSVAAPVCSLTAVATAGVCQTATNTYSTTVVVTMNNSATGRLTVTDGPQSLTFAIPASLSITTARAVFTGFVSNGSLHTVTISLPGCSTTTTTYSAPGSCTQHAGTQLILNKFVNKPKTILGGVLTYTLVLTNTGTTTATNVVVRDSATTGLTYVTNSATAPSNTTFTPGTPTSAWRIASLLAGQSVRLTFQAIADSSGILYNTASIPGDTVAVCTSVPVLVCPGSNYAFELSAPAGSSQYRFYNGTTLVYQGPLNSYTATTPGSYSIAITGQSGCPGGGACCPFIIEEDTLPAFQARAVPVTCSGTTAQTNGQIVLSKFRPGQTYQYSIGTTFNPAAAQPSFRQSIPSSGVIVTTLSNPVVAQSYTVRVYNRAGCYMDVTVSLPPTLCTCPAEVCVPYVIQQTKRAKRIGDTR